MERLNYNHLYYFYMVGKEGSIKAVSDKIHVSQPTISDQIRLLENYFKCRLFERKGRKLVLNREGLLAFKHAEKIFDMGQELSSKLRNRPDMRKKNLDIGITHFTAKYYLYESIMPVLQDLGVTVNILEGDRKPLLQQMDEGRLDIVLTDSKDSLSANLDFYPLGTYKTYAMAHKKFKKFKSGFPVTLNQMSFFNYSGESQFKYGIEHFFSKFSIAPKIIGEASDAELLEMVTRKGLCFTIVPEQAKNRFMSHKDIIVLGELKELQLSVWGIMKNNYRGVGYNLIVADKTGVGTV